MTEKAYSPEEYWNTVAKAIKDRSGLRIIAGDDEPFYRYKRKLFLKLLDKISFENKTVLEVGSGPGGNLEYLTNRKCKSISGVDISAQMIELSKNFLSGYNIEIRKTDGLRLPFDDNSFDLIFTSTVLQHITDERKLRKLTDDICRVSASDIFIFERIEKRIISGESNAGRPISYYKNLFEANGFILSNTGFLKIQASFIVCGVIRKLFNRRSRKEGEPVSKISLVLQKMALPLTQLIDKIIPSKRDLGMMHFRRMYLANSVHTPDP